MEIIHILTIEQTPSGAWIVHCDRCSYWLARSDIATIIFDHGDPNATHVTKGFPGIPEDVLSSSFGAKRKSLADMLFKGKYDAEQHPR